MILSQDPPLLRERERGRAAQFGLVFVSPMTETVRAIEAGSHVFRYDLASGAKTDLGVILPNTYDTMFSFFVRTSAATPGFAWPTTAAALQRVQHRTNVRRHLIRMRFRRFTTGIPTP